MDLSADFKNLDIAEVGDWPVSVKIFMVILLCIAILGAGIWFNTKSQLETLEIAQKKEEQLKQTFEIKQHKAANLEAYKQQLVDMKRSFGSMLRQLPSETEVAELLVDISQAGLTNGLEFELFKPEKERPVEFYAELPIKINVKGNYHQFGSFASDVVALPRIVTLHDIEISRKSSKDAELTMRATAKTFRYFEEEGN